MPDLLPENLGPFPEMTEYSRATDMLAHGHKISAPPNPSANPRHISAFTKTSRFWEPKVWFIAKNVQIQYM